MKEGPTKITVYTCVGCNHLEYTRDGWWWCTNSHITGFTNGGKTIGNEEPKTPGWCPLLKKADDHV